MGVVVVLALIGIVAFGVSSTSQSYATAQQAQAQIEVAKAAQISATGNVISIVTSVLVAVVVLMLIAAGLWILYKRSVVSRQPVVPVSTATPALPVQNAPQLGINDLIGFEILRMLREMRNGQPTALPAPRDEQPSEEPLHWLR